MFKGGGADPFSSGNPFAKKKPAVPAPPVDVTPPKKETPRLSVSGGRIVENKVSIKKSESRKSSRGPTSHDGKDNPKTVKLQALEDGEEDLEVDADTTGNAVIKCEHIPDRIIYKQARTSSKDPRTPLVVTNRGSSYSALSTNAAHSNASSTRKKKSKKKPFHTGSPRALKKKELNNMLSRHDIDFDGPAEMYILKRPRNFPGLDDIQRLHPMGQKVGDPKGDPYHINEYMCCGNEAAIYTGVDGSNHPVVIKIERPLTGFIVDRDGIKEKRRRDVQTLELEANIMQQLARNTGFPKICWCGNGNDGVHNQYKYLVMEQLGSDLSSLFEYCHREFSEQTVTLIARKAILRLKKLHEAGYMHRDIKPENFCVGATDSPTDARTLFLIDFGSTYSWVRSEDSSSSSDSDGSSDGVLRHILPGKETGFIGSQMFAPVAAHQMKIQGRRGDLESLGYMLYYFLYGVVPWQKHVHPTIPGVLDPMNQGDIASAKSSFLKKASKTCMFPPLKRYLMEVRDYDFYDQPDYKKLFRYFDEYLLHDSIYDWELEAEELERRVDEEKKRQGLVRLDILTQQMGTMHDFSSSSSYSPQFKFGPPNRHQSHISRNRDSRDIPIRGSGSHSNSIKAVEINKMDFNLFKKNGDSSASNAGDGSSSHSTKKEFELIKPMINPGTSIFKPPLLQKTKQSSSSSRT